MSVLDPRELEASPLADLHALAAELGLEGYRRLRKEELITQLVTSTGGEMPEAEAEPDVAPQVEPVEDAPEPGEPDDAGEPAAEDAGEPDEQPRGGRGRRGFRGRRGSRARDEDRADSPKEVRADSPEEVRADAGEKESDDSSEGDADAGADDSRSSRNGDDDSHAEEEPRTGVLDVLPNGSGFIRAEPYRQSREDVYVSPAQIRRCELRPGDEVSGPARPPRRNERHPSLVRVATVNGTDADTPSERPRFESLTATWPTDRLAGPGLLADTPFGKGSRVAVGGPPGAGATWLLREAVKVLRDRHSDLEVIVVLAGVRPEEAAEWTEAGIDVAGGSYDGSFDEQAQIADLAVQRAKRAVESGRDAVVVIDSLDTLPPAAARRVFGAGRNAREAGSLTILAATGTAAEPHRMATTHVTLEPGAGGGEPRLGSGSGTLRRDLLN